MGEKAVCLLSGGLDSATVLAYAISKGYQCYAISFNYGQRHMKELVSSEKLAQVFNVPRIVASILMADSWQVHCPGPGDVEKRDLRNISDSIPNTYVPSRNIIFLSMAASFAESHGASTIFIGANALDYSGYPDCRPEFYNAFENALNIGTDLGNRKGFKIKVPLQYLKKSEIIKLGKSLGVPYELTSSCYEGGDEACGECDSCLLRLQGFMGAELEDPIKYKKYPDFYEKYLKTRKKN
ncbi:MAG: 7-cyano-7-deazaguanine synthase QueC [Candidatus Thermoplasmatota archaeon]|nr:7-cyano-7-deazaguanine synthase QueC [Candidatus Thermoplasmatota archaeon]